jgi:hypothetical protein
MNKTDRLNVARELHWYAGELLRNVAEAEALVVGQEIEEMDASQLQWIAAIRKAVNGEGGVKAAAMLLVYTADDYE